MEPARAIRDLLTGAKRFTDLDGPPRRDHPKTLTKRLRELRGRRDRCRRP